MSRLPQGKLAAYAAFATLMLAAPGFCQQSYVTRYDAFVGYGYLNSPALNLPENGVQFQIGVRPKTWYSLGFDFFNATGNMTLGPNLLLTGMQQSLATQVQQLIALGRLPATYSLSVAAHSKTQTFAAGPQLAMRHWKPVTLFIRPSIGLIREAATPLVPSTDLFATGVVKNLAPSGDKRDTTPFYGVGGGFDFNIARHFALRVQGDIVYDHLFKDLLQNGRRTYRFSIGPAFNFGKNIVRQ